MLRAEQQRGSSHSGRVCGAAYCACCRQAVLGLLHWCGICPYSYEACTEEPSRASSAISGVLYQAPSPPSHTASASSSHRHSPDRADQERARLLSSKGEPSSTELHSTAGASGESRMQGPTASGGIALEATGVAQPDSARMSKRLQSVENIRKLADARDSPRVHQVPSGLKLATDDDEDCCPTCLDPYSDENPKILTQCNHHFHLACIYEWLERSPSCPVCSRTMTFEELM